MRKVKENNFIKGTQLQMIRFLKKYKSREEVIPNSLQIWYEGLDTAELQLDVNIWRLKNRMKRKNYLDFGIKLLNPNNVRKIFIYLPFIINKTNILSLGGKLENASLLNGIFNENYNIQPQNKNILVKDNDGNMLFSIYNLNVEKDIVVETNFSGTVMSFDVKNSEYPKYYRFRIQAKNYGALFEKYKPNNSFFESAFIETEMIDFRINEKRNQDSGLMEKLEDNRKFIIRNINFFVMSPIQDEIESDGINLVYKRQLEMGNFWKKYLGCSYKRMSVYKTIFEKSEADDFSCFCLIKYRKCNLWTIILYLLVLCSLSVSFNLLSNYLWSLWFL